LNVYGQGVNFTARITAIANPYETLVMQQIHDELKDKKIVVSKLWNLLYAAYSRPRAVVLSYKCHTKGGGHE